MGVATTNSPNFTGWLGDGSGGSSEADGTEELEVITSRGAVLPETGKPGGLKLKEGLPAVRNFFGHGRRHAFRNFREELALGHLPVGVERHIGGTLHTAADEGGAGGIRHTIVEAKAAEQFLGAQGV